MIEVMTKQEIIEFLKQNLSIVVTQENRFSWSGFHTVNVIQFKLGDDVISEADLDNI